MPRTITLPEDRLLSLMKMAYCDGFDDGAGWTTTPGGPATSMEAADAEWAESVTQDAYQALVARVRAGGKP
jgi:hypothetical protein